MKTISIIIALILPQLVPIASAEEKEQYASSCECIAVIDYLFTKNGIIVGQGSSPRMAEINALYLCREKNRRQVENYEPNGTVRNCYNVRIR